MSQRDALPLFRTPRWADVEDESDYFVEPTAASSSAGSSLIYSDFLTSTTSLLASYECKLLRRHVPGLSTASMQALSSAVQVSSLGVLFCFHLSLSRFYFCDLFILFMCI